MCEERDSKYFDEDKPQPEFSMLLISSFLDTPKRVHKNKFLKKSNSSIENDQSRNFKLSKSQSTMSNKYKKTISFNMEDVPEPKPKMIREESKSSKSREEKKTKPKTKAKPCECKSLLLSQYSHPNSGITAEQLHAFVHSYEEQG